MDDQTSMADVVGSIDCVSSSIDEVAAQMADLLTIAHSLAPMPGEVVGPDDRRMTVAGGLWAIAIAVDRLAKAVERQSGP